jgi:hypothetical protein
VAAAVSKSILFRVPPNVLADISAPEKLDVIFIFFFNLKIYETPTLGKIENYSTQTRSVDFLYVKFCYLAL